MILVTSFQKLPSAEDSPPQALPSMRLRGLAKLCF